MKNNKNTFIGKVFNMPLEREQELCDYLDKIVTKSNTIEEIFEGVNNGIADFDDDNERYFLFLITGMVLEKINAYSGENYACN